MYKGLPVSASVAVIALLALSASLLMKPTQADPGKVMETGHAGIVKGKTGSADNLCPEEGETEDPPCSLWHKPTKVIPEFASEFRVGTYMRVDLSDPMIARQPEKATVASLRHAQLLLPKINECGKSHFIVRFRY